ncbi:uncharacterized protein LOC132953033 [Metopolophium dirhodum]|uniref:uncharacterized protein LOC132953033 n=1 Tax=Metopolophium dirhodum TaxID=44670 RepID=UPI0029906D23|nr:uncharacterized protein LOC132953033 [Metopolophium dirhodum]
MTPMTETSRVADLASRTPPTWQYRFRLRDKHDGFNNLPSDCRTILQTPSSASKHIRKVEPGLYHHFGLANGIKLNLPANIDEVKIAIGIDGLPISKSSSNQFWPILAYIEVESPLPKHVFLVGLYYGTEKPHCSNDFLLDFTVEANELTANGIMINSVQINVIIDVFCCDSPAKSFILKVKGHSGFSSCTRCNIEGEYIDRRPRLFTPCKYWCNEEIVNALGK